MIHIGQKWQVLDHGYIKLLDFMGKDESIIEAARTSTMKGFQAWGPHEKCRTCGLLIQGERAIFTPLNSCDYHGAHHIMEPQPGDEHLLDYLWRHGHYTPFEMVQLKIEVKAPILVWRQWMRSRTQSYNEASGRYAKMGNEHYLPSPERVQAQSKSNKQGSEGALDPLVVKHFLETLKLQQEQIYETYESFISDGIANETARDNTPLTRYSTAVVNTDLRNWLHFLNLRMDSHAQWETRQFANFVGNEIVSQLFPRTWAVFQEYTLFGVHFSKTEMDILRDLIVSLQLGETKISDLFAEEAQTRGMSKSRISEFISKLQKGNAK